MSGARIVTERVLSNGNVEVSVHVMADEERIPLRPPRPVTRAPRAPVKRRHRRMPTETEALEKCAVCTDRIGSDKQITPLTKCPHFFHSTCVDKWLDMNHTCPTCRSVEDAPPQLREETI